MQDGRRDPDRAATRHSWNRHRLTSGERLSGLHGCTRVCGGRQMNTESLALTVSLLHGWAPVVIQALTAVILVVAIGWRSRRWLLVTVPVAVLVGAATAALAR